jgi:sortase (surface protein transpeptidase)
MTEGGPLAGYVQDPGAEVPGQDPSAPKTNDPQDAEAASSATAVKKPQLGLLEHLSLAGLLVILAIALTLAAQLAVVSVFQHRSAQQGAFDKLRKQLALGTAPVAQTDTKGRLLALSTPVALLDIPSLHVHEIVLEGTTPAVLMSGPGHRRDTPMPGQAGTSIVYGRAAAFGGPFKDLHRLKNGAKITFTTGQGVSTFNVIGRRRGGDMAPPPPGSAKGRLILVTATGASFLPGGVLRVDADLASPTMSTPPLGLASSTMPHSEQPLGTDSSSLWALVLWLEALIVVAVAVVWSWTRWGRHQTWIVFFPLTVLIAFFASDQFIRLLPNLT